jgi:formiminotetrahydrofolate cyclodeaminase
MPRFADLTVSAFTDALASAEPTPGGGTAAAVGGAMGAALLMMVAGLPKTRHNSDEERAKLGEARAALTSVRERLLVLADTDSDAYNQVISAYRLAKESDADKAARRSAIQSAMKSATEAPLETLRTVAAAMGYAKTIAQCGNPSAASDVRVALELLEAAGAGAAANVDINLTSLGDESYRKSAAATMMEISNRLTEDSAATRAALLPTT